MPALRELRSVVLHPAQNCGVCKTNTSFAHHGGQIAIAQLEIQIPPDAQDDDLLIKVPTAEQFLHRYELGASVPSSPTRSSFAPEPFPGPRCDQANLFGSFCGQLADRRQPEIDGSRRQAAGFQNAAVLLNHGSAEWRPGLGRVPGDEILQCLFVGALGVLRAGDFASSLNA